MVNILKSKDETRMQFVLKSFKRLVVTATPRKDDFRASFLSSSTYVRSYPISTFYENKDEYSILGNGYYLV